MANQLDVAHYDVSERPVVRYQQMNADKAYKSYELLGDYQLYRQNVSLSLMLTKILCDS